jgi:hypothetical protein
MQRFTTIMFLLLALVGCNLAVEPPLPTPDVPLLEFHSPPTEARVIEGATLGFDISARDSTVGIEKIIFFIDGSVVQEALIGNYEVRPLFRVNIEWTAQAIGWHDVSAIAYRPDGTQSREEHISIEVIAP